MQRNLHSETVPFVDIRKELVLPQVEFVDIRK